MTAQTHQRSGRVREIDCERSVLLPIGGRKAPRGVMVELHVRRAAGCRVGVQILTRTWPLGPEPSMATVLWSVNRKGLWRAIDSRGAPARRRRRVQGEAHGRRGARSAAGAARATPPNAGVAEGVPDLRQPCQSARRTCKNCSEPRRREACVTDRSRLIQWTPPYVGHDPESRPRRSRTGSSRDARVFRRV